MPTKAQNEVYARYRLRKSETRRAIGKARDILSWRAYRAYGYVLTKDDVAAMHVAGASLVHLSEVWRAYQECDRE